jgi:hypothetical protein
VHGADGRTGTVLGFFMIFAMWLFPEVKREESAGGVRHETAPQ